LAGFAGELFCCARAVSKSHPYGEQLDFYAAGANRFLGWLLGSIAVNDWIAIGLDKYRGNATADRCFIWASPVLFVRAF
jgi:hypothetical protein